MKLFTDFLADLNKDRAGQPYRPANATEGDMFFSEECNQCIHKPVDNYIHEPIDNYYCLTEELCFWKTVDNPLYPIELQYGTNGQPCCRRKTLLPR